MTQSILIIYELIPDETRFYLIPQSEADAFVNATLDLVVGKIGNSTELNEAEQEAITRLSDWLAEKKNHCSDECPKEERCRFAKHRVQPERLRNERNIVSVVWTGFYL